MKRKTTSVQEDQELASRKLQEAEQARTAQAELARSSRLKQEVGDNNTNQYRTGN